MKATRKYISFAIIYLACYYYYYHTTTIIINHVAANVCMSNFGIPLLFIDRS